jgi:hypothetical protein
MKKILSALIVVIMVFSMAGGVTATLKGKGSGTIDPFHLELIALKGLEQTDLYIHVQPNGEVYQAPEYLKKIQLKSYDADTEELVYTRNYNEGISSAGGKGTLVLTDVERYQPLQTMVHVKNEETQSEVIMEGKTQVLLRPDLVIGDIQSPEKVQPNTAFNVSSQIKEINNDVGASARIELLNGSTVLDSFDNVSIAAGSEKGIVFLPSLSEPGTYTLTLRISGADPAEYDTSNNEKTFTIEVVDTTKPIQYHSSYWYQEGETHYQYRSDNGYFNEDHWEGKQESFSLNGSTTAPLDPAGTFEVVFHNENGEQDKVNITLNKYDDKDSNSDSQSVYTGSDSETNTFVSVYPSDWGATFYLSRYSGDYIYSKNWSNLYSSGSQEGHTIYGKFINAKEKVGATIDLPGKDGVHHGGKLEYGLTSYQTEWNNSNNGSSGYSYHSWGNRINYSGSSNNLTTTE